MKKLSLAVACLALLLCPGCIVTSVCPFFHPKDVTYENWLEGRWTGAQNTNETWKFEGVSNRFYTVRVVSCDETNVMNGHLFRLRKTLFLDLETAEDLNNFFPPPIPAHTVLQANESEGELRFTFLNYEWMANTIQEKPSLLRHYYAPDPKSQEKRLILTDKTDALQKFLLANLRNTNAWQEPTILKRAR